MTLSGSVGLGGVKVKQGTKKNDASIVILSEIIKK